MAASLAQVGIHGAFEGALQYVGNPDLISRTHFARFLVDAGHCADVPEVFRRYLTEGKPGFVPHKWAALRDAVGWITRAGGIAVIATHVPLGLEKSQSLHLGRAPAEAAAP